MIPILVNVFADRDEYYDRAALNHKTGIDVGLVSEMRCTYGDAHAYAATIAARWESGRTFIVAEHDVVVTPVKLVELRDCRHPWCACVYAYPDRADVVAGLGLTKFDASLLQATPDLVDELRRLQWWQLDDFLFRVLSRRGYMRHLHGRVEHTKGRANVREG